MFSPVSVCLLAGMSLRESGCASHSSGCAFECRICNRKVAGSNLGRGYFAPRFNSAFHPSRVGKWVPASAGKAKAGMAHSDCGWTCGCAGKTVKSLENARHTLALLRWWFTTKSRYIKCMNLLPLHYSKTTGRISMKFYGVVGNNPDTNRFDIEWPCYIAWEHVGNRIGTLFSFGWAAPNRSSVMRPTTDEFLEISRADWYVCVCVAHLPCVKSSHLPDFTHGHQQDPLSPQ